MPWDEIDWHARQVVEIRRTEAQAIEERRAALRAQSKR